jgi:hypothetical protein
VGQRDVDRGVFDWLGIKPVCRLSTQSLSYCLSSPHVVSAVAIAAAAAAAADDLSRQALMAQAEDLAVEDCLLVLEKALLQGKLTPEAYMKQVRVTHRLPGR